MTDLRSSLLNRGDDNYFQPRRVLNLYEELHTMAQTTFSQAKAQAVEALRERRIEYEARELQSQKNLLSTGAIDAEMAITLIQSTRGHQANFSPHHADRSIQVWVFEPKGWYIKFYLLEGCCFISFHPC